VTNFRRSTKLSKLAMSYNRGLDRDKDGIAAYGALFSGRTPVRNRNADAGLP